MAKALYDEIEFRVPGGPSPALYSHMEALAATPDDYVVINIGQLKNVVKPFYDFLAPFGGPAVPWPAPGPTTDDYAPANLGQLKNVFAQINPASLLAAPAMEEDTDDDGLTGAEEAALGTNPNVKDQVFFGFGVTPIMLRGKGVSAYFADLGERLRQHPYPAQWEVDNRYRYLPDGNPVPMAFHNEPEVADGYNRPSTLHRWYEAVYFAYPNTWTQPYDEQGHSYAFVRKNRNAVSIAQGQPNTVYVTRFLETFRTEEDVINQASQLGEMRRWVTFYTKTGANPSSEVFSNEHEMPVPAVKGTATLHTMSAAFNLIGQMNFSPGVPPSEKVSPGGYGSVAAAYPFSISGAFGGENGELQYHLQVEGTPGTTPEIWTHDGTGKVAQINLSQPLDLSVIQGTWLALVSDQPGTFKLKLTVTLNGDSTVLQDVCKITLLRVTFDGPRVYDPRLAAGQPAAVNFKIEGPDGSAPPVELAVVTMWDEEVACLVQKTESPPSYGVQVPKTWDGRYGNNGDGDPTEWQGKYASPGIYKVRLRLWHPASPDHPVCSTSYQINLVRLGVTEIGFLGDQKLVYHKTEPNKLDNYPFASATQFDPANFNADVVWKIEHLDFVKSEGLSRVEARVGQKPEGESYLDTDNLYGRGEAEWYFDADGSGSFSPGLRQVNFPPLRPTSDIAVATVVETDRFNRPVVVVGGMPLEVWFKVGEWASTDETPESTQTWAWYPTSSPPIRATAFFRGGGVEQSTGVLSPGGGPYTLQTIKPVSDFVGVDVETISFRFEYEHPDTHVWMEIPGQQDTEHLVYRLAAAPTPYALTQGGGGLFMKIVDFTCYWALGWRTPDEVFQQIWNGSNFWTPINAGPQPRPDNANGFRGRGDPSENARQDAWQASPMCYTFRHDLNHPYPIPGPNGGFGEGQTVDGWLDLNYARCGGWAPVLNTAT
jgi:hypothetical protein